MGWFWSSNQSSSSSAAAATASTTSGSAASSAHATPPAPASSLSDDPEVRKFLSYFQESGPPQTAASSSNTTTTASASEAAPSAPEETPSLIGSWKKSWSSSSSSSWSWSGSTSGSYKVEARVIPSDSASASSGSNNNTLASTADEAPETRERSLAEAVLPTTMSCRQAFDLAWGCQSPVGQWRAVYRHGSARSCSELWDDFWFCTRVKGYAPGAVRDEAVRAHYRERERARYYAPGQPSSEDVWRSRTVDEVLPPGAVFQQPFRVAQEDSSSSSSSSSSSVSADAAAEADASQVRADMERRRRIRQQMGYDA